MLIELFSSGIWSFKFVALLTVEIFTLASSVFRNPKNYYCGLRPFKTNPFPPVRSLSVREGPVNSINGTQGRRQINFFFFVFFLSSETYLRQRLPFKRMNSLFFLFIYSFYWPLMRLLNSTCATGTCQPSNSLMRKFS